MRRDGGPRMTHAILNPSSEGSTWGNGLRGYDLKYARRVPRVRKFEWGSADDHSFVPSAMSLASLSIGSQARGARVAAIGSFASSQPTSYAETSQRLLEPQGSAYLETKPYPVDLAERDKRVAKQWFSPNLIGNVKQRKRRYKTPASRGASQSIKVQNKDYDRRIEGGRLFLGDVHGTDDRRAGRDESCGGGVGHLISERVARKAASRQRARCDRCEAPRRRQLAF